MLHSHMAWIGVSLRSRTIQTDCCALWPIVQRAQRRSGAEKVDGKEESDREKADKIKHAKETKEAEKREGNDSKDDDDNDGSNDDEASTAPIDKKYTPWSPHSVAQADGTQSLGPVHQHGGRSRWGSWGLKWWILTSGKGRREGKICWVIHRDDLHLPVRWMSVD